MFAELVRAARRRLGLTQEELAERAGVSVRSIGNIELGRITSPQPSTVRLLADAFGLAGLERDRFIQAAAGVADARHRVDRSAQAPIPAQLPPDVHAFTGRDQQLAHLNALLNTDRPTAVIITAVSGTAGVGKTALAVYWAHQVQDRFPDGQLYVNLRGFDPTGPPMDPAVAIRGFLDALQAPPRQIPATLDGQIGLYRSLVADRRVLILLDNARDAEQVRPLLPGTGTAMVVVTSRDLLTPLVATEGVRLLKVDLMSTQEARELLTRRLGQDRAASQPDAVDAIIEACARLPLALTITAARAEQTGFPLAILADEFRDMTRRLDTLDAGDPASQIRDVFSWSYNGLKAPAARLFRLLGLHPGPDVSAAAAASLAGYPLAETRRLLSELVRASLLTEPTPGRYAWHDLLRAYAAELVSADPEPERRTALQRLLNHYTHTAHAANRLMSPSRIPMRLGLIHPTPDTTITHLTDYQQAIDWLSAERPVLLAALHHAARTAFDTHAWQLAWCLDTYLDRSGYWQHRIDAWQSALESANRLDDQVARPYAHRCLATAYAYLDRYEAACHHLRCSLDLFTQIGSPEDVAYTHHILGFVHSRQGDPRKALHHSLEALAISRGAGDQHGEARMLNNVGWHYAQLDHHDLAIQHCQQALPLLQQLGDQNEEAATWDSLGYAHRHLGRHAQAIDCYRRSIDLSTHLGASYYRARSLTNLGDTHLAAGDPQAARNCWQQALNIFTELNHPEAESTRAKLDRLG